VLQVLQGLRHPELIRLAIREWARVCCAWRPMDPRLFSNDRTTARRCSMLPVIGYALREQNRLVLDDPAINGVEITFERADDPLRVERYLGDQDFAYVSVHALQLSVASPDAPHRAYLDALRAIADENGAASISDHLGFTRDGNDGFEMGHFAPPPYTSAALDATCRNIEIIQRHFRGLPFYVENIAYLFRFQGTMSEADFLVSMLERTGCGWLLDVTNIYANSINHAYDARDFICQVMPAARQVEMHLAGGFLDDQTGLYIDSHSEPVSQEVWDLYRYALELGRGKVKAVFIERDQNYPNEAGWRSEIRQTRRIAEEVEVQR
jgi:uncharacterized protein